MAGLILMIIGVLLFITGLLIFQSTKKVVANSSNNLSAGIAGTIETVKQSEGIPDNELEKAIEMAIADGVLSNNERKIIKEIATRKGFNPKEVIKDVEKQLADSNIESETELIDYNKKQGDDFEKFVVQKFNKKYYRIKEWAGDKHVNGVYAETTTQPDILAELNLKDGSSEFWVECKWRQNLYNGGIEFASKDQFERYKNYQESRKIPVFVAIGFGGKGASPDQLFIVPLDKFKNNYIHLEYLKYFEKKTDSEFFYNSKTGTLR